jgi:L-ascorbate metabolism protein UlaG (beta-lactamase superfamily)
MAIWKTSTRWALASTILGAVPLVTLAQRPATVAHPAHGGDVVIAPITHGTLQIRHGADVVLVDPARFTPGMPLPFPTRVPGQPMVLPPGITPRDSVSAWPVAPGHMIRFESLATPTLILVTDDHDDHLDPKAIEHLRGPATTVVGPAVVAAKVPGTVVMANGDTRSFGRVGLQAIPMYNLRPEPGFTEVFHTRGRGNGYVLTVGGTRVYVAGDTACTDEMRALRTIDIAFVPMNLPATMSPADAAACVKTFAPKVVYPYHFHGSDVGAFAQALEGTGVDVRVLDWYAPLPKP